MKKRLLPQVSWRWAGLAVLGLGLTLLAQDRPVGRVKNFAVPDYDAQNRRKAVLYGEEAISGTNGLWNIQRLRIESYAGQTNPAWVVEAPACLYHDPSRRAWSDGPLSAVSADGQLSVTGEGFDWQQMEQRLVISNQVRTLLRPGKPQPGAPPVPGLARHDLELTANRLIYEGQRSAARYSGHVRVRELLPRGATNPPVTLDCDELTIFLSTNRGGVEVIEARQGVVFTQGPARLHGELARYTASNDVIHVEGGAHWETEQMAGQADRLVFDRGRDEVRAFGNARTRLREAAPANQGKDRPPPVLELAASAVVVTLPASNRPLTSLVVTGGVTLTREDLQAGGESLHFSGTATSGVARISGQPWWRSDTAQGRAAELMVQRPGNVFSGRGRGEVTLRRGTAAEPGTNVLTIQSEEYDLAEEQAVFRGRVVAEDAQWRMEGETLKLRQDPQTRQVRAIAWEGGVTAEQRVAADSAAVPWRLQCQHLMVEMAAADARPTRLLAAGNIQLEPARLPPDTNRLAWKLQCEHLTAGLDEHQQLSGAVAEQRVYLESLPQDKATPAWAMTGERLVLTMAAGRTNQVERLSVEQQVTLRQIAGQDTRNGVWHLASQRAEVRFNPATGEAAEAQADGGVHAVQLHSNLTRVAWTLTADTARLAFGPSNRLERLQARRGVRLEQGYTTNLPPWQMQCGQVDLAFSPTNTLQQLEAREAVVITQGASRATGAVGYYRGDTEDFELRGQPSLLLVEERAVRTNGPPRQLEIEGAEVLVWNREAQTFRGRGPFRIRPGGPLRLPGQP
ncbi:MAG: LptA/OstA family protein [Verrucomicrobiae bacterium]|nr:LptA/OstA family protein [Verrucomicrobiae bacterium]